MNIFLLLKLGLSLLLLSALVDAQTLNLEDARTLKLESVELLTPTEEKTSIKIQMKEYNIDNKSLLFKIKNISDSPLENVKFVIYINGENLKNESDTDQGGEIMRFLIPSGKVLEDIRFDLPDKLKITEKTPIKLQALQGDKLLAEWNNVTIQSPEDSLSWFYGLIGGVLFIIGTIYISLFLHPLTKTLSKDSSQLLNLPLQQLRLTKILLKLTWRLDSILNANESYLEWLDNACSFSQQDNIWKCTYLAKRLNLKIKSEQIDLFEISLGSGFPLNLTRLMMFFPNPKMSFADIKERLQQADLEEYFILIISFEQHQSINLQKLVKDRTNLWIAPSSREMTAILLSPDALQVFVQVISKQLTVSGISPYQTVGGVKKKSIFFGREKILTEILNRNLSNYLLLGGRQMGKSSLLKQIERWYEGHPTIECFYFSLSDHELLKPLARHFGLSKQADLDTVFEKLANLSQGKRYLFLIDEADKFARVEMQSDYPILSKFRSLSDEGKCFFILAGFWDLYEAALLDYQSPLRNFGKPVIVGELEEEACRLLATEPMKWLGISYQNDAIIDHLIKQTGQRANLVALICDEVLKQLGRRHIIEEGDIKAVLNMPLIESALSGWTKLTHNENASRLDRIIVYATASKTSFEITELIDLFDQLNLTVSSEDLNQSLLRLQLAFILVEKIGKFYYCVPLFQELLQTKKLDLLLNRECNATDQ